MIVGLGNPGPEYRGTRHNVGFEVIDQLADDAKLKLATRRHRAIYGSAMIGGHCCALVKPLTYMNLSGQSVAPIAQSLGIKPDHILVIADDVDLPVGKIRLRAQGSPGGHNGHKSIVASLKTSEYPRVKIGVGAPEPGRMVDHVLGGFNPGERKDIHRAIEKSVEAIECVVGEGIETAMTRFNG